MKIIKNNEKWPYIPDHLHRIIIIGGSGSGKTHALINLINEKNDTDKIYLYARDYAKHLINLKNTEETKNL